MGDTVVGVLLGAGISGYDGAATQVVAHLHARRQEKATLGMAARMILEESSVARGLVEETELRAQVSSQPEGAVARRRRI